ncbi:MAG: hypothetical protein GQ564_15600 [Bacteroidales bacterium]|nr:hypothetical protein [Bacteroidales bacterium]
MNLKVINLKQNSIQYLIKRKCPARINTDYLSKCALYIMHVGNVSALTPEVNSGQAIVIFKDTFSAFKYTISIICDKPFLRRQFSSGKSI